MIPVTPWPISRGAAACPPSSEKRVRSTSSAAAAAGRRAISSNAASFRSEGHVVRRAEDQADPLVAEVGKVRVGLLHRDGVVGRDAREVEVLGGRVDEDDRQPQLQQARVVLVRRVGLGVLAAGEDHPGDLALEQHLDVLGLRHAAGARAQHRVETALGERARDDLRQRGKSGSELGTIRPTMRARRTRRCVGRS